MAFGNIRTAFKSTEKQNIKGDSNVERPPYSWAVIVSLVVGLIYSLTLAPTTAFWDTSEYIATGHILGIPHPPGNPLFVVLARTWDILLSPPWYDSGYPNQFIFCPNEQYGSRIMVPCHVPYSRILLK